MNVKTHRIIHCADLHLDARMTTNLTKDKARERQAELLNTFREMIRYAEQNDVNAIIIAGDLYDTQNISAAARNTVKDAIIDHASIVFYYLKGNHDAESFLEALDPMPDNLRMFGESWTTYREAEMSRGSLAVTGIELNRSNRESAYHELSLNMEDFNIVVMHGQEAEQDSGNGAETITLRKLRNRGIDYLALGHVHAYKLGELDSRGQYCYCGCLEGRGFDECGEHGFVLLSIDTETGEFQTEFVPIACRTFYTLEADISGCMSTPEIARQLRSLLDRAGYRPSSLLKIVLKGRVDVECEKNLALLQKEFEPEFYFLKLYDETRLNVDYNSFALDESLKGEFVRTVWADQELSDEEKAEIIRCGIQALAGEEIE